jgi:hypothetical protein
MNHDALLFGATPNPRLDRARRSRTDDRLHVLRRMKAPEAVGATLARTERVLADPVPFSPMRFLLAFADVEQAIALGFRAMVAEAPEGLAAGLLSCAAFSEGRATIYLALALHAEDFDRSLLLLLEESGDPRSDDGARQRGRRARPHRHHLRATRRRRLAPTRPLPYAGALGVEDPALASPLAISRSARCERVGGGARARRGRGL